MKPSYWLSITAAAFILGAPVSLPAQDSSQYYSVSHAREFKLDFKRDLYDRGDQLTAETRKELSNHLNLTYGESEKQRLDVYLPKEVPGKSPVLVFFHGGGFSEGDRAHYGFIARPFAPHGIITVVASYRLSGAGFPYPAPPNDAKQAVIWVHKNIAQYGGDPDSIFVTGHSAGGILAADLGSDRAWLTKAGISKAALKGIAPVSAPYNLDSHASTEATVYAPTPELRHQATPIFRIKDPPPIAIIGYGSDTDDDIERPFDASSHELASALRAHGVIVSLVALPKQNDIQTVLSLGDPASPLTRAMLEMIQKRR